MMEIEVDDAFIASNAEYFAGVFAPLSSLLGVNGPMRILSEESEMTVAVGLREVDESGEVDVDCVVLQPNQESVRDCLETLFTDD